MYNKYYNWQWEKCKRTEEDVIGTTEAIEEAIRKTVEIIVSFTVKEILDTICHMVTVMGKVTIKISLGIVIKQC